jgi:xanthine dehydrogenase YagR molybdenum-binding subunit
MTQVAADTLGLPMHQIRFELGDSDMPAAPVSGGSMTVASVAPSVQAACLALVEKIKDLASTAWPGVPREAIQVGGGQVRAAGHEASITALMERGGQAFLEAEARTAPGGRRSSSPCMPSVPSSPRCGSIRIWAKSGSAGSSALSTGGIS